MKIKFMKLTTAVFTLNEPDINGITASDAASWYIQYVNPLVRQYTLPFFLETLDIFWNLGNQEGPPRCYFQHDLGRRP